VPYIYVLTFYDQSFESKHIIAIGIKEEAAAHRMSVHTVQSEEVREPRVGRLLAVAGYPVSDLIAGGEIMVCINSISTGEVKE
jgi:hypothetical protein